MVINIYAPCCVAGLGAHKPAMAVMQTALQKLRDPAPTATLEAAPGLAHTQHLASNVFEPRHHTGAPHAHRSPPRMHLGIQLGDVLHVAHVHDRPPHLLSRVVHRLPAPSTTPPALPPRAPQALRPTPVRRWAPGAPVCGAPPAAPVRRGGGTWRPRGRGSYCGPPATTPCPEASAPRGAVRPGCALRTSCSVVEHMPHIYLRRSSVPSTAHPHAAA